MGIERSARVGRSLYTHAGTVEDVANFDPENLVRNPIYVKFGTALQAADGLVPASFTWTGSAIVGYRLSDGDTVTPSDYNGEIPFIVIGTS